MLIDSLRSKVRNLMSRGGKADGGNALQSRFDESDTIFVCFPKCGSTWLEIILTQYLVAKYGVKAEGIRDLFRVTRQLQDLDVVVRTHDDDPHLKRIGEFERDKGKYRNKKVLMLVRDPRDVLISYYFEYTKKKENQAAGLPPFKGTPDEFLHYPIGGIEAIIEFYNIWAENHAVPREFHLVRYEDIHSDTVAEIERVLRFIGESEVDQEVLRKAIDFASFDNMRSLEERGVAGLRLNPHVAKGDTEGYKTRKGKVGGYVDYLSPTASADMEQVISTKLSSFFEQYRQGSRC
jgi:hypothetical protein